MTIKISGTFKKDEREYNGLENIAKDLLDHPLEFSTLIGHHYVHNFGHQPPSAGIDAGLALASLGATSGVWDS